MLSTQDIGRQLRETLEEHPGALPLIELLSLIDDFVHEVSSIPDSQQILNQLEDELQSIHHTSLDHNNSHHSAVFLAALYHLGRVLSSTSIISRWFELVLRPALRDPRLAVSSVDQAKWLILSALKNPDEQEPEKAEGFRRRLFDLYLFDAHNEGSEEDLLEWAELSPAEKGKKTRWKANLEDVLTRFGVQIPQQFLSSIYVQFATPGSRLRLLMLLNQYTSDSSFQSSATIFATHPIMNSLFHSLLLDNSPTTCWVGLTLLTKLVTIFAVDAGEELKLMLPMLFAILSRVLCWKAKELVLQDVLLGDIKLAEYEVQTAPFGNIPLGSGLEWNRLQPLFGAAASYDPSPRTLFTALYYLFPCNILRYMRGPLEYLEKYKLESPYSKPWEEVLDEGEIRSRCESLLRRHICHHLIIQRDAIEELSRTAFWKGYDLGRIKSEMMMLDIQNATIGNQESQQSTAVDDDQRVSHSRLATLGFNTPSSSEFVDTFTDRPEASAKEMINSATALGHNLNAIAIAYASPPGSSNLALSKSTLSVVPEASSIFEKDEPGLNVAQAMSGLQREVFLLRTELNFERWLAKENVKHIGRLFQEKTLSKNAEAERQGLYNKLRSYRAQVVSLERQLKEHKEQSSSTKHKYADWSTELLQKLRDAREEKKSWTFEAATVRAAEKDMRAQFKAQGILLAEASNEIFALKTQIKTNQPQIDRLRDYERQIEMHLKMQKLWDTDFQKFNERAEQMQHLAAQCKKMQLRLDSSEESHREADDLAREYKRKARSLEIQLSLANEKLKAVNAPKLPATAIREFAAEKQHLTDSNKKLRRENADLRDEIEEVRVMVEALKEQVSGRKGLVSEARTLNEILTPQAV